MPIITRDPEAALHQRFPALVADGGLEQAAALSLRPDRSHIMLCGNPAMVEDTRQALMARGLTMNRKGVGNIAVENYW